MSSVPFSPRNTCWHGRALKSEVIAQCVAGVCRAEQAALLQLGHHKCHEVVKVAGKQRRGENEAVTGFGLEPGLLLPNRLITTVALAGPRDAATLATLDGVRRWRAEIPATRLR